ncbi:hypothetical protein BDV26DRAFT_251020 [Aspergillus bertholletiae]|uniref:Uncharacterized protein n=1 Tax=Aspergillus bertholletiae TaxID=1226010 RepID=A0A5N7BPY4_9EURO|nr:hypothetical protein BDV26DRAFT_251020 [Aspergillus bertholletiae]
MYQQDQRQVSRVSWDTIKLLEPSLESICKSHRAPREQPWGTDRYSVCFSLFQCQLYTSAGCHYM